MNKKSKKTLKNAFNIPEPERKEKFFSSLETKQKKRVSFNIPLYISTAVTAVVIMGIWGGVKNLPYFDQPENIDTPVYSETTSLPHHTEKSTMRTTTASSTKKNTTVSTVAETSGISTVSGAEKTETTVQTTIKTETLITTTAKESNNISYKPTTQIRTAEKNSVPETTKKTTIQTTVTARTTTRTTSVSQTTVTTEPTNIIAIRTTTTTTRKEEVNCVTTTTYMNVGVPETTFATMDIPPQTVTTTTEDNNVACTEPPRDFTVVPPVQYYPDNEIYIIDSESNDGRPPASPGSENNNEIFRKMAENSDLIVVVTVDEIIYTGFDGKPYTQENAVVMDVIYGDIPINSRISIYCMGGYIPADEYYNNIIENDVTVLDYAGNRDFSQVGDTYVCFLKKSDGDFPDESYYLTGLNDISKFAIYGDSCVNINNNDSLTLSQIQSFLN